MLIALRQIEHFLRDVVQTHLSGHRGKPRNYHFSQQSLDMVPVNVVRIEISEGEDKG